MARPMTLVSRMIRNGSVGLKLLVEILKSWLIAFPCSSSNASGRLTKAIRGRGPGC